MFELKAVKPSNQKLDETVAKYHSFLNTKMYQLTRLKETEEDHSTSFISKQLLNSCIPSN